MFLWLASYPKSGNTLVRSMIATYFFTNDGIHNFNLLKNIGQFPDSSIFENMGIDIKNEKEVIKNYIKAQEIINKKNSIQFFKTHSHLFNINNHLFTNLDQTLGVIYVVRDPRNVVLSWSKHTSTSIKYTTDKMINNHHFGGNWEARDISERTLVYSGTWNSNFNSWKSLKLQDRYLLIKYEDLVNDKEKTFLKILNFLSKFKKTQFTLDTEKFTKVLETTDFKKMQNLEKKEGFREAKINQKTGEKIPFFNLGPENNWKNKLDTALKDRIEKAFKPEMEELGYL